MTIRRAVVAGGGIIGTWHALELAEAGFAVDHLESEAGPTGASVRNFGLVWVSGRRSGTELDVARGIASDLAPKIDSASVLVDENVAQVSLV